MPKTVEFFFDFGSPTAYLAWTQLPKLAADAGAQLVWRPMLLGGVFKATGNASPAMVPAKGRWMNQDMARWARRYGVPLAMNPFFPINTLTLMRGATGLQLRQPADFERYVETVYRAMWEAPCNMGDPVVLAQVLQRAGFDVEAPAGAGQRSRGQGPARRHHRRSGGARRVRRADDVRRRADVLRPGPARLRARGLALIGVPPVALR